MSTHMRSRRFRAVAVFVVALSIGWIVLFWKDTASIPYNVGVLPSSYKVSLGGLVADNGGAQSVHSDGEIGRVLITGAGGNIGKQLVRSLLERQVPIIAYDLIFDEVELQQIHADLPQAGSLLQVIREDIRNANKLASALAHDVAGVIHLAAVSRVLWCLENQEDCEDVNVQAVDLLLSQMTKLERVPWLIQASSREVYGTAARFPVLESDPTEPANVYGASKLRAEQVIQRHVELTKSGPSRSRVRAIALRLSNVYGSTADHRARLIPALVTQAIAHRPIHLVGGKQDLDMVHIQDVTSAFVRAAIHLSRAPGGFLGSVFSRTSNFEAINIVAGRTAQALSLVRKIMTLAESNSPIQIIPGDDRFPDYYIGSGEKAERLLGHKSSVHIDEGLLRLVTAYQRENQRYLQDYHAGHCQGGLDLRDETIDELDGCMGYISLERDEGARFVQFNWNHGWEYGWFVENRIEPAIVNFHISKSPLGRTIAMNLSDTDYTINMTFPPTEEGPAHSFGLDFDLNTGFARLKVNETHALTVEKENGREFLSAGLLSGYNARLVPTCCPGRKAPWPLYREDPLTGIIDDLKYGEWAYPFDSRHSKYRCGYVESAIDLVSKKLGRLGERSTEMSEIEEAILPTGAARDWVHAELPTCLNMCSLSTICVDTGNCSCVEDACSASTRFPFAHVAHLPVLSHPPQSPIEPDVADGLQLVNAVAKASWLNVLRPHVSRYLSKEPEFPSFHITKMPDDVQNDRDTDPSKYDKLRSHSFGCFSADGALERGLQMMQGDYSAESMVFLPFYAGTLHDMKSINDWADNALEHHLPPDFDQSRLVIPFTFDWGICQAWTDSILDVRRDNKRAVPAIQQGTAWSVMGDLNSNCYRPEQDVVIPSRTCLQDQLKENFGDLARVMPSRQRTILSNFKGRTMGQGAILRKKLTCGKRPYQDMPAVPLTGATEMPAVWGALPEGMDYMTSLNHTVFCPLPRGVTGWATRTIDAVYAGCIPVLIGDKTHHPFFDMLDWTKFSIIVDPDDLDHLEEVLMSRTWADVSRLQTNLMLVRDAFLYPTDGEWDEHFTKKGPLYYALHATALIRYTKFPSRRR